MKKLIVLLLGLMLMAFMPSVTFADAVDPPLFEALDIDCEDYMVASTGSLDEIAEVVIFRDVFERGTRLSPGDNLNTSNNNNIVYYRRNKTSGNIANSHFHYMGRCTWF